MFVVVLGLLVVACASTGPSAVPSLDGATAETPPGATPVAPTPVPNGGASTAAGSPASTGGADGEQTASRFETALENAFDNQVTGVVTDWTGRVTGIESGTPGEGVSVENGQVAVAAEGADGLRLTWAGGPCDQTDEIVVDRSGSLIVVISAPCGGDSIATDRQAIVRFDGPVDAGSFMVTFQPGGDTGG
jgi:hypothetical protein